MATSQLPSPDVLRQLLRYESDSGKLFWRHRQLSMFTDGKQPATQNCAIWNSRFADGPALATPDKCGYHHGIILYAKVKAHRAIWAIVHGEWPNGDLDHIDGDTANNRLGNLRLVSHTENMRNMRMKKNNKSGHTGVYSARRVGFWSACISVCSRSLHLGTFPSIDEAIAARKAAETRLGYHKNHGTRR